MTAQQPAESTTSSWMLRLLREHLVLVLGFVPLTLTVSQLLLVSHGDDAAMVALVQNVNLTAVFAFTVVMSFPVVVLVGGLLILTGGGASALPALQGPGRGTRMIVTFLAVSVLLSLLSLRLALMWFAASAGILGMGYAHRWLVRRNGDRKPAPLVEPLLLLAVIVGSVVTMGPWLPAERITLSDGNVRVGYVVSAGDPMTVLWREGGVVYLEPTNLKARQVCATGGIGPGILSLRTDMTPLCPTAKVSRTES